MSISAPKFESDLIAIDVRFEDDMICLDLDDGREVRNPLEFYPRLARATKSQLEKFRLIGGGTGIHWSELDEDLSVNSIVLGLKAFNE